MPWQMMLPYLINQNVGVSLVNGNGAAGKLCSYDSKNIYLLEYLYQSQFATKHYPYGQIQNIMQYPNCSPVPTLY
jgi:hypothetical protein